MNTWFPWYCGGFQPDLRNVWIPLGNPHSQPSPRFQGFTGKQFYSKEKEQSGHRGPLCGGCFMLHPLSSSGPRFPNSLPTWFPVVPVHKKYCAHIWKAGERQHLCLSPSEGHSWAIGMGQLGLLVCHVGMGTTWCVVSPAPTGSLPPASTSPGTSTRGALR